MAPHHQPSKDDLVIVNVPSDNDEAQVQLAGNCDDGTCVDGHHGAQATNKNKNKTKTIAKTTKQSANKPTAPTRNIPQKTDPPKPKDREGGEGKDREKEKSIISLYLTIQAQ